MSAKEMFEKLGYECERDDNNWLIYNKKAVVDYKITFVKRGDYNNQECVEIKPTINGQPHYFVRLDIDLLQAINKQVEELGWNNENR